jgi:tetratricopeptide (TPR) repeat protein
MLNDAEVISALSQIVPDEFLAQSLIQILHVPEVWEALHTVEVLDQVSQLQMETAITPGEVAFAIHHDSGSERDLDPADSPDSNRAAGDEPSPIAALVSRTSELIGASQTEEGRTGMVAMLQREPASHRSSLACAWPYMDDHPQLLDALIDEPGREVAALIANTLLANSSAERAADRLSQLHPLKIGALLLALQAAGETELVAGVASNLAEADGDLSAIASAPGHAGVEALQISALIQKNMQDYDEALRSLNAAWEKSSELTACIADELAAVAHEQEDPVMESAAHQQAIDIAPTPLRRACLVTSLVESGRLDLARSSLPDEIRTAEEWIAAGELHLAKEEMSLAADSYLQAFRMLPDAPHCDISWFEALIQGLRAVGENAAALKVARHRIERVPHSYEARVSLAYILQDAGDPVEAADQARLALALQPGSREAKKLLAENLQFSGVPSAALPIWKELVAEEGALLPKLAECAFGAGDYDLARRTANQILESEPDSPAGLVVMGKSLTMSGEYETALTYLHQATEASPECHETWTAMADCLLAAGQVEEAQQVLTKGIHAGSGSGHLHISRSRIYRQQGELNQALEDASLAVEMEPEETGWLLEQAEILRELGRVEDAIPKFEAVLERQPAYLPAQLALARIYESREELPAAAKVIADIPSTASAEAKFIAGRILVNSDEGGQPSQISKGLGCLESARDEGFADPALPYWLGRGYEQTGDVQGAFECYREYLSPDDTQDSEYYFDATLGLGRTAIATSQSGAAVEILEEARLAHPASAELLVLLSEAHLDSGDLESAQKSARQAAEFNPQSPLALKASCKVALALDSLEEAMKAQERLVKLPEAELEEWFTLADLQIEADNSTEARSSLAHGLMAGKRMPEYLARAARTAEKLSQVGLAGRVLRRAAGMVPDDISILREWASMADRSGDYETSQHVWLQVCELAPDQAEPLSQAAAALEHLDRHEAATSLWQRALLLEPENAHMQAGLARSYIRSGEEQKAIQHFSLAFELAPADPVLGLEVGRMMLLHGSADEALAILGRATELDPQNAQAYAAYAECLLRIGRVKEALPTLEHASGLKSASKYVHALHVLALMEAGDMDTAREAYRRVQAARTVSPEDVIWSARAALSIGEWSDAANQFSGETPADRGESRLRIEHLAVKQRLHDLHWLLNSVLGVIKHAPQPELMQALSTEDLAGAIHGMRSGHAENLLKAMEYWRELAGGDAQHVETASELPESAEFMPEILQAAAMSLLRSNRPAKAEALLKSFPGETGGNGWIPLLLGLARMGLENYEEARTAFHIAARNPFIKPMAIYLSARASRKQERLQHAIDEMNECLAIWSDEPAWNFELANDYIHASDPERALAHLQQAVEHDPANPVYLVALARILRDAGQLSEAENAFGRALETSPKSFSVWKEAGQVALAVGKAEEAETWFERASTLSPSDAGSLIGSAKAASLQGKIRNAAERAQAALRLAPNDAEVLSGMADIMAKEGKLDEALRLYSRALKSSDNSHEIRIIRGRLMLKMERPQDAVAELKAAITEAPDRHDAWGALAEAYEKLEDYVASLQSIKQARELAPRNTGYLLAMGRVCRKSGQLDRALDELSSGEAQSPKDPDLPYEIGLVHEARRESEKALDAYRRCLVIKPDHAGANLRAGLILKDLKVYSEASELLGRAAEMDPKDPNVLHQLAAVRALQLVHGGMAVNP